jgi:CarD family transcriptional regulator
MRAKKHTWKKNDRVVYPPHGPVTVVGTESVEVFGEKRRYLVARAEDNDLVLRAPLDRLDEIGVRPPMPKAAAKEVLKILSEPATAQSAQWSRRFKAHNEKLHSGDPIQIAELIRNLELADAKKPVSAGEKRLLKAARHSLEGELAITWETDREAAAAKIDKALASNPEMKEDAG